MGSHRVLHEGGAQALTFAPHKRVTSATYIIENFVMYASGSDDRTIASGAATLNPCDTTISQAGGPNTADPRLLVVAAATNLTSSHRYVITDNVNGQNETFTVDSLQGLNVKTEVPLLHAYPNGSAVQGLELSANIPAETASDTTILNNDEPLRIMWQFTLDGVLTNFQELIRIVHHNRGDVDVDGVVKEIQTAWGGFGVRFEDGRNMRGMVMFAIRDIERVLMSRNIKPEEFLMGHQGFHIAYWRTLWHMAMLGNHPPNVDIESFKDECKAQYEGALNTVVTGHPGVEIKKTDSVNDQGTPKAAVQYRSIIRKA